MLRLVFQLLVGFKQVAITVKGHCPLSIVGLLAWVFYPCHIKNQKQRNCCFWKLFFFFICSPGDFSCCTILFSDVVTFTNICSVCEPIQIVNMLNLMYSKFDRLTNIHGVYKVSVADVYNICCCLLQPKGIWWLDG